MVVELEDRYVRLGMTREEVIDLLGPADGNRGGVLVYELGYSVFGVDTEAYEFAFDADGRLTQGRIIRR
jgi:hypothetical protein